MEIIKRDGKTYICQEWAERLKDNSKYGLPIGYDEYIYNMFSEKVENTSETQ